MEILKFVPYIFLFVSLSSANSVVDFCVADFNFPDTSAGFSCRNPANLTVDDFVFSGLGVAADPLTNIFRVSVTSAFDLTFPAHIGLGLSMSRLDIGVGGVVPIHSHRVSELILVIEGEILAGFIDSNDQAYYKTLTKGDITIFPQSLLHFQINVGKTPALAFVSLNSASPNFQTTTTSLFANDLPTDVIEKITLLDVVQAKKLKRIFGGSN
ncbi:auxin-binding protein ABP19a-like [Chenopodium quinoa]|uniref:Germin-like protein n=1 Tax=Chenopodium quinoa TaxID=63459 RepID=A0A803M8I6_CHEQI|nr:auxin-binding protein ABP19a-like [Chenopodium quinoa]